MTASMLQIKTALRISKGPPEIFEAIVNPAHMSNYFIRNSTGKMEPGATLQWQFPESEMKVEIRIDSIEEDKLISYRWDDNHGYQTKVSIVLNQLRADDTMVIITEEERPNDAAGIVWLKSNTEGWANFLACLKAYMEFGINLRKNAFDPSQMPD